jgi:conjugative transfer signal peptidase TraF
MPRPPLLPALALTCAALLPSKKIRRRPLLPTLALSFPALLSSRRIRRGPLLLTLALACATLLPWALRLRLNTSASLPRGLYRLTRRPPRRGSLVLLCPPPAAARLARARGYLPAGPCPGGVAPLGKMLLALPGDTVEISPRGLALDGRPVPLSRLSPADSLGRPLPAAPAGRHRLAPGQVWVYAPHPRSFDSRTFGPVADRLLLGTLEPLWTESRDPLTAAAAAVALNVPAGPATVATLRAPAGAAPAVATLRAPAGPASVAAPLRAPASPTAGTATLLASAAPSSRPCAAAPPLPRPLPPRSASRP